MPLIRLWALALLLGACAPKTGQLFTVSGPKGKGAFSELELVVAHPSYCERWVTDSTATGQHYDVSKRDLHADPLKILLEPAHVTDLSQAVRAIVVAHDASGDVVGYAAFGAHPFRFEKVDEYKATISPVASDGPRYVATDGGCACFPGQPEIGNGSGQACDERLPPSFARLADTAGCELPKGEALPSGVCDGQLYPNEVENRTVPCFAQVGSACLVGTRTCNDQGGSAFDSACAPASTAPALPSTAFCDAFSTCEQTACADPIPCTEAEITQHFHVLCSLPVAPASVGGVLVPCTGAKWSAVLGAQTGAACTAAMLDGTQVGPVTVGFAATGQTKAQVVSATCPPMLQVDTVNLADPASLPATLPFTFSLGDDLYDVELEPTVGCAAEGDPGNDLRCVSL